MDDALAAERAADLKAVEDAAARRLAGAGAPTPAATLTTGATERDSAPSDVGKYLKAASKPSLKRAREGDDAAVEPGAS